MSLVFRYVNTTGTNRFNVDLGNQLVRLGSITSGFIERAELGEPGNGGVEFDDSAGTLTVLGLQFLKVAENSIAAGSDVIFNGYINDRKYSRGDGSRASLRTGASRMISVDIADFNQILSMRKVRGGDRPAESAHVRLAWLLGLANCPVHDYGYVQYPGHAMDKNDYTGNTFKDVLADIAAAVSYNFFAQYDQSHDDIGLHFYDPNSLIYTSTAVLSNLLGSIDQVTTFECTDIELTRSPSRIASGVDVAYTGGRYYGLRLSTADTYAKFDQSAPVASVKTLTQAQAVGTAFLNQSDVEDDRITLKVKMPAAHVNDIRAGHRILGSFTHLANEGYGTGYWFRVMSRTILQDEDDDSQFNVALELTPQGAGSQPALDTVTLSACNGVLEPGNERNANAVSAVRTFHAGEVWRVTLTNPQHAQAAVTDSIQVGGAGIVAIGWGASFGFPGWPTGAQDQGFPPAALTPIVATFTVPVLTVGTLGMFCKAGYYGGLPVDFDECWQSVFERIA